jgi:hypothetical protein
MARMFNYYDDWRPAILECGRCGWKGTFDEGCVELYEELMDSTCPRCPDTPILAIVSYPTIQESEQNWSRLSAAERQEVAARKRFLRRWDEARLRSADQLPDLEGPTLALAWDIVEDDTGHVTVLRHGHTAVWHEPALWEGYERFAEIVLILREKYGARLVDVVPTEASKLYLYGDKLSAPDYVRTALKSLKLTPQRGSNMASSGTKSGDKRTVTTARHSAAAKKAALTKKRRATAQKAATTRKRNAAAKKAAVTRKRRTAAKKAAATRATKKAVAAVIALPTPMV